MKKITALLFILLLLFINLIFICVPITTASTTIRYVATAADGGSDSNSGLDAAHPFRTIQKAINRSANGDIIYVRRGVYTYHNLISVNRSGTASNYFTIMNYNGEHPIIDGTYAPHYNYLNSSLEIKGSDYVRISGLHFNHSYMGGITVRPSQTYIRIDNCTIGNCSDFAIKVAHASYVWIENNYIYNNHNNWSSIGGEDGLSEECVSIEATSHGYIFGNTLYKNHCELIDLKGGCSWIYLYHNDINTTGEYKVYKWCAWYYGGVGIYLDARGVEHNISIYNNRIWGNNTAIQLNNEGTTGHLENISIYNNIINITNTTGGKIRPDGRFGIIFTRGDDTPTTPDVYKDIQIYMNTINLGTKNDCRCIQIGSTFIPTYKNYIRRLNISNNIFTNNNSSSFNAYLMSIYGLNSTDNEKYISLNNNLYNNSFPGGRVRIRWDENAYYASSPSKWGHNPVFEKPLYIAIRPPDFHLQSASPCIGAATPSLVADTDYAGLTRPQGGTYDIGAYEYSEGDNEPPQIVNIAISNASPLDTEIGWENFTCTVTDNIEVSSVMLKLTNPDQSTTNIPLTKKIGTSEYYTNQSFHTYGDYSYRLKATDTSNNNKYSSISTFLLPPNWDINGDGTGSLLDLVLISNYYGTTGNTGWIREDVDNSGKVKLLDVTLVSNHFGESWNT